ncbi:MAG TPA: hypothetical protein VFP65_25850 [Anaeromyxobacteraceae bacterium]|nr:hypothetical protein [Anaeromyxobacteraceae bacterium]
MYPHLAGGEQSVGTGIWVTHGAVTPPGFTVTVEVVVTKAEGRRLTFSVRAHDGVDAIREGTHQRLVIDRARFDREGSQPRLDVLCACFSTGTAPRTWPRRTYVAPASVEAL